MARNCKPLAEVLPWPLLERERKRDTGALPRWAGKALPLCPLSSLQPCGVQEVLVQSLWELTAQEGAGLAQLQAGLGLNSQGRGGKSPPHPKVWGPCICPNSPK